MLEKSPKIMLYIGLGLLLGLILAPLSHRFGILQFPAVLQGLLGIAAASALLALAALIVALVLRFRKLPGAGVSRIALVVALIPIGVLGVQFFNAQSVPPIHDISTDWQNPPLFSKALQRRSQQHNSLEPNPETIALQHAHYGNLGGPQVLKQPPQQVLDAAEEVARELGWDVIAREPERLEAVDKSFWFGFRDDIVVRVRPVGADASVLDIRSASRIGVSDLGKNAERIRDFLERFRQETGA